MILKRIKQNKNIIIQITLYNKVNISLTLVNAWTETEQQLFYSIYISRSMLIYILLFIVYVDMKHFSYFITLPVYFLIASSMIK